MAANKNLILGSWLSSGSPVITELAVEAGFHWLLIDLEHGNGTEAEVLNQLRAFRGSSTLPIVRVGAMHADLIGRLLDWGAAGIMVPHVNSADQARRCVEAMRYPPRGHRGVSRTVRAYGYGFKSFKEDDTENPPLLIAQIETAQAVLSSEEIAAVDGVDVLFVGPSDLKYDLEKRPHVENPDFANCLQQVAKSAHHAGKASGLLMRNVNELDAFVEAGFQWIAVESDLGILRNRYREFLSRISKS